MSNAVITEVVKQMETLPESLRRRVLEYIRSLKPIRKSGVAGKNLPRFAGVIPLDDLKRMGQAIEPGCEKVDLSEW